MQQKFLILNKTVQQVEAIKCVFYDRLWCVTHVKDGINCLKIRCPNEAGGCIYFQNGWKSVGKPQMVFLRPQFLAAIVTIRPVMSHFPAQVDCTFTITVSSRVRISPK